MNDFMVSVIVPIYNAERYLQKCIDSILSQTYSNYEIILVNDGSYDRSALICDEYSSKYDRVRVIHKKNGGLSDARNCGISAATGDFIMFVDSDDYLESTALEILVNAILKTKLNIAQMKSYIVNQDYTIRSNFSNGTGAVRVLSSQEYIVGICNKTLSESVCDKLFTRKIFQHNKFEVGRLNEDFLFLSSILLAGESIAEVDYSGYYYYQRLGSISHSGASTALTDSIRNGFKIALQARKIFPDVEIHYIRFSLYQARTYFLIVPWKLVYKNDPVFIEVLNCVANMRYDIFKTNLSVIDKIFLRMVTILPKLTISGAKLVYYVKKSIFIR